MSKEIKPNDKEYQSHLGYTCIFIRVQGTFVC